MADLTKMPERMSYREKLCATIQNDVTALAMKINKLAEHDLETFSMLNEPDALFNDCPISPFKTHHHLRMWMIKKDMDFIGYALDGKVSIKPFLEMAQEASKWVLRFSKEKKPVKKGVDAII